MPGGAGQDPRSPLAAKLIDSGSSLAEPAEPEARPTGPRDSIEALLCEVWGELLDATPIGIDDNVFDLGAHSLTVMWAAARILDRTGMDLPKRWFYQEPTVAGLARLIAGVPAGGSTNRTGSDAEST